MDLPNRFEVAGGSVPGRAHAAAGRNNQDAFTWANVGDGVVAVVCDGCGSSPHSEVGAKLGARLLVRAVVARLAERAPLEATLEAARMDVLARLRLVAGAMSGPGEYGAAVLAHFLFTVVGAVVSEDAVTTFTLGDGLVAIDGARRVLGPFENNEPPYLGYALLGDGARHRGFDVRSGAPARSVLLGTDGAVDLDDLGPYCDDDRVFANPDTLRRRLTVQSRAARLSDDTTLVAIRRRPRPSAEVPS